jgi:molybdopterin molybdotransferase
MTAKRVASYWTRQAMPFLSVLPGDLQTKFIDPQTRELQTLGVDIRYECEVAGVSMGDRDLVKGLLGELAEVHIRRIFMKPGKPFNFATSGDKLLFGLPGNPVSSLVGFETFVAPALRVMQGAAADVHPLVPVTLAHDVEPSDRIEHQRAVVWSTPEGTLAARNTGSQISARLMSFVGSNAFLVVPPGDSAYPAGARLDAILLGAPYVGPR